MPMATKVYCFGRNTHVMTHANGNVAVASRAQIHLVGFIWLHTAHLNFAIQAVPH